MKTYSETKRRKPFNWNEFLNKDKYTIKELEKAEKLANSWVTCACGNQCSIIERVGDEPIDNILRALGYTFVQDIKNLYRKELYKNDSCYKDIYSKTINQYKKEAKSTLLKIEKRSSYLINRKIKEAKKLLKEVGIKKL